MSNNKALEDFVQVNGEDLQALGLFFLRLLQADFCVIEAKPSPVLVTVMSLSEKGKLGMKKPVEKLIGELLTTRAELLTDGFGGSMLRL